jgi:hypothetical protein
MSNQEEPQNTAHGQFVRHKRSKGQRDQKKQSRRNWLLRGLWLLLLLLSLLLVLNPWTLIVAEDERGMLAVGSARLWHWLAYEGGSRIIGLLLLGVTAVWGLLMLRDGLNNNTALYATACPNCGSTYLKRTRRNIFDKLANIGGIPVRRYVCTECKWQGARIDHTRLTK